MSKELKKIYLIGIGGISMSAIAVYLHNKGYIVEGSDVSNNFEVKKLIDKGIKVNIEHKKENIDDSIDAIVYSKAISDDNEEILEAKNKNISLYSRSEILGMIMKEYDKRICVAGTHGKTTTTSIVSKIMLDFGLKPTINIGGDVSEIGGNFYEGDNKDYFIIESCEYTNSFLDFFPNCEIITNIDLDHLDFFKNISEVRESFQKFIGKLDKDGILVINENIENLNEIIKNIYAKIITFGKETSNYFYKNNRVIGDYQYFDVYKNNKMLGEIKTKLLGEHNAMNIISAIALLIELGIDFEFIQNSIIEFSGAKRRLEYKGTINGVKFIDDYAHHPSEIIASLTALNNMQCNKLFIIFQPHTFSRTIALFNDFINVLSKIKNLVLVDIYPAREKDEGKVSSKMLCEKILENSNTNNNILEYSGTFENASEFILANTSKNDIVVTMGAGDVHKIYNLCKEKCV